MNFATLYTVFGPAIDEALAWFDKLVERNREAREREDRDYSSYGAQHLCCPLCEAPSQYLSLKVDALSCRNCDSEFTLAMQ